MTRYALFALLPLLATGCEALGLDPADPWNGETVSWWCSPGEVQYTYASPLPGAAHPSPQGCYQASNPDAPPWNDQDAWADTLYQLCTTECSNEVDQEAASLGRTVLGDTCYQVTDDQIGWTRSNCNADQAYEKERELQLTYTPPFGDPVSAKGTLSYTVHRERTGSTLELGKISLATPLSIATGTRDATALLGFPEGTLVSVNQVAMLPLSLPLDRYGNATLNDGDLNMEAYITIREPGAVPLTQVMSTKVPFRIDVSSGRELTISSWSDGFGGRFSIE